MRAAARCARAGGKLYLNYNAEAAKVWAEAIPANIRKGEENWPRLNPL